MVMANLIWMLDNGGDHENNVDNDVDTADNNPDNDSFDVKVEMTIRIITFQPYQVGPCRVLAEGGCLGGLLAPRF